MASKSGPAWDMSAVAAAMSMASIDPHQWVRAMDVVSEQTGSVGAVLIPVTGIIPHNILSGSLAGLQEIYLREGWHEADIRKRGVPVLKSFGVFDERHYTTEEEMRTHPYFQDLLVRLGLRWSACVKMQAGDDLWTVALQRSPEQGAFTTEELTRLQMLSAHLATAGAAAKALGFARIEAAIGAFDASGTAVMLLDRETRVIRANARAERLIDHDLQLVKGRLRPRNKNGAQMLNKALHALLWNFGQQGPLAPPVVIPRAERMPLLAYPSRVASLSVDPLAPCQLIVVFQDPEQKLLPSVATLKACFGLTDAEARIAAQVASGLSVDAIATKACISRVTARNQLSSTMKKMGVRRQAELVAAVIAVAPSLGAA